MMYYDAESVFLTDETSLRSPFLKERDLYVSFSMGILFTVNWLIDSVCVRMFLVSECPVNFINI